MSLASVYGVYIVAEMLLVDNVVCDYHFYCQLSHLYECGIGISILEIPCVMQSTVNVGSVPLMWNRMFALLLRWIWTFLVIHYSLL